jgi:hypothetical protein
MATKKSKDLHLSFAIGTTVKFRFKYNGTPAGYEGLVTDITMDGPDVEYGVNGGAWYPHSALEFVSYPTADSLLAAWNHRNDEDEDEDDEEDGEFDGMDDEEE